MHCMKCHITSLLLAIILLACNNAPSDSGPATEPSSPVRTEVTSLPTGSNFVISVLNDSIKSPLKELKGTIDGVEITILYGSPAINGRTIFGELVPYGSVWRTGANEATQISFSQPLFFGEQTKAVPPGKYALLSNPKDRNDWTIILNQEAFMWGAYDYDPAKDVAQFPATGTDSGKVAERLDFTLTDSSIRIHWADLIIEWPVKAAR